MTMKNRVFQKILLPPLPTLMMEAALSLETKAFSLYKLLHATRVEFQYKVLITSQLNTSS